MTDKIQKGLDLGNSMIKFVTPIGLLLIILLQSNFVTKDEIKQIQAEVTTINTLVTLLVEREKQNDRQDKAINAMEEKLQALEISLAKIK